MKIYSPEQQQLSRGDRSHLYGDGCFTTCKVTQGRIELWPLHLQRLQQSCERLQIAGVDWTELQQQISAVVMGHHDEVFKILISAGVGGRGYGRDPNGAAQVFLSWHPLPIHYQNWQRAGIRLHTSSVRLARQPLLAGIKHLNRLEQVLIKNELANIDADDALVLDDQGFIIESSAANLLCYHNGQWMTPSLVECGVEGVMRNHLLRVSEALGQTIAVQPLPLSQLNQDSQLFLCNSLMGVVPAREWLLPSGQKWALSFQELPWLQRCLQEGADLL